MERFTTLTNPKSKCYYLDVVKVNMNFTDTGNIMMKSLLTNGNLQISLPNSKDWFG